MKNIKFLMPITLATILAMGNIALAETSNPVLEKTPQELEATSQSQQGLEVKTHADGSRSVDLEGRFQMTSVAKMVDGKIVYSCQGHDAIESSQPHQHQAKTAVERGER